MVDAMRVCSSVSFSSSEQDPSSCDDESTNSAQFDRDNRFYSSDEEYQTTSRGRKRLQSSQNSDDSRRKCTKNQSECLRRLPTRKPDPNTFNRNAIMARENRRKKKEYVEKLENEVDSYKSENKKLRKMLKQQFKVVEKISHERSYLRSVLANKTQIMSLMNVIKNSNLSKQSPIVNSALHMPIVTAAGLGGDLTEPDYDLSLGFERFDDYYLASDTEVLSDTLISTSDNRNQQDVVHATINEEHNYFAGNNNDVGVCLHVSGGQLSLEFCSTCNDNAKNSWLQTN